MYKISEFSKITNLTVKALRYYDDEKILRPSYRDQENGYRYYDETDFRKAQLVTLLRSLSFSIAEIKDVLACCDTEADVTWFLEEKKNQIIANMERERSLIGKITDHIQPKITEELSMDYQVSVKDIPAVTVAAIRFVGKYSDVGNHIGDIYKAVKGNGDGSPFCLYYDSEFKDEADIELCVPVKKTIQDKNVVCKTLPPIKAIGTTHKGSYETLSAAYKALLDYSHDQNLKLLTPSREVYVKGPGMLFRGNVNSYITEILIPFEGQ